MQLSQTQSLGSQWVYSWKHPVPVRFSVRLPLTCALCTRSPRPRFLPRLDFVSCHSCYLRVKQFVETPVTQFIPFVSIPFGEMETREAIPRSEVSLFGIDFPILTQQLDERGGNIQSAINNNSISTFPSPRSKLWARVDRWKSANWLTNPIRPAIGILGNE